jgi:hypothetical protein
VAKGLSRAAGVAYLRTGLERLNILRKLGTHVEYGVFGSDTAVDWSIISDDKELNVLGSHLGPNCWPAAIRMIESGMLPMDKICTHQLPLAEFQRPRPGCQRHGVGQGLPHPLIGPSGAGKAVDGQPRGRC